MIICGDCVEVMAGMDEASVDMALTSPPYDDLRAYKGYTFDARAVLEGLWRVIKPGGVVCWVVADQTKKGGRTGTSFRHALAAQEMGFLIHDVIIWVKPNTPFSHTSRYTNCFEYVFVLSKGKPKTFHGLRTPKKEIRKGRMFAPNAVGEDGKYVLDRERQCSQSPDKIRTNVWTIPVGMGSTMKGTTKHPAMFPERLADDCIRSWSAPGDLVLDPMNGAGTTCVVAKQLDRRYVGIDISEDYCQIARERLAAEIV